MTIERVTYRTGHLFCGMGGGAAGLARSRFGWSRGAARAEGRFETAFGVDVRPDALAAFEQLTGGRGVERDLFSREDYERFHGHPPPRGWREVQPEDLRAACGEAPDVLYSSPPCVGMSRLISASRARGEKYQAVNSLTVRGIMLALEAWADAPPRIILLENVPGLQEERGRHLLQAILSALDGAGYSTFARAECLGELGGLGQRRTRLKLIARHRERVAPLLFRPTARGIRSCGDVLGPLPLPGDPAAGPMHRLGRYTWITLLRLALVPAGADWRALAGLRVSDGVLDDYVLVPLEAGWHHGALGVTPWAAPTCTMTGRGSPMSGAFAVADVRAGGLPTGHYCQLGVVPWGSPVGTVTAQCNPGTGAYTVADVRVDGVRHCNVYRVVDMREPTQAVTGGTSPSSGGQAIADVRTGWAATAHRNKHRVGEWAEPSGTVTGSTRPGSGGLSVADPRLPEPGERGEWLIIAPDGTWHRPLTALDKGVLQGFDPSDLGCGEGSRDVLAGVTMTERQRLVGNAVPPPAAEVMGEAIGTCLLSHDMGEQQSVLWRPDLEPWAREARAAAAMLAVDN